ncbi:MAG: RNA polymerase sigma factor [Chthoniobacteraceae bacterium]
MQPPPAPHSFQTTRWSVVQRASSPDDRTAREALASLCEAYWFPIYAYIRRSGRSPHDAEDGTQGFFAWLLARDVLARADAEKGRLRTFLLTCLRRYLADEQARAQAQKRGGGLLTSFDALRAEENYAAEPRHDLTPDRLFQRRWALTIIDRTLALLADEFTAAGKAELFAILRPFLGFTTEPERGYEEVAAALGMPLGTVKNHVFRLRKRWRELIFAQVGDTLADPNEEEIKGELSELLGAV